ncbi:MAG: hypothetical protein ACOX4H_00285 [Bacillota bacterium]|jgi:hypothetical protein|nr:hypothetical protein [Clostridia bacterium]
MSRKDKTPEIPPLITPETVQVIAENAEALKGILGSGDEQIVLKNGCPEPCCCPKLLKFKFIACNVWIINDNADCSEN